MTELSKIQALADEELKEANEKSTVSFIPRSLCGDFGGIRGMFRGSVRHVFVDCQDVGKNQI
mgnify:CR=1 FL=1